MALVASAIAVTGTPAQAAPTTAFTMGNPNPGSLSLVDGGAAKNVSVTLSDFSTSGDQMTVSFDPGDAGAAFTVSTVSGCSGDASGCTFSFSATTPSNTVVFKVTPKSGVVKAGGSTKSYSGSFTASCSGAHCTGADNISKSVNLSLAGQQLYSISGIVKDAQTGQPVKGALVNLQDSANHSFTATTGSTGKYTFASSASQPIQVGTVTVGAVKDGYEVKSLSPRQFGSGNITNWNIALTPKVIASASATPSATPSDTSPTDAATDAASASTDSSADAGGGTLGGTKSDSGGSSLLTIVLVAGVLLMLGGGGAIAFMFYRRRNNGGGNDDDYDDDPRVPGGGMGGGMHPSSGGPYRNAADPTALVRSPMAEAPTMMHRPAPSPRRSYEQQGPGYGGYDGQPTYADPHPSARPPSPRPAADPYQGYPQQPAYAADPTGYMAPPADRGRGGYPPANGYDQGYGPQGHPGGPAPTQTYQQAQGGYGYADQNGAGYDQGYGSSGGYGGNTQPAPGGYNSGYADQNGAGYDQGYGSSGGYGGNTQPAPGGYNSGYADQNGAGYDQGYGSSGGYGGNTQPAPGGYGGQPAGYGGEQGGYAAPQGGQGHGSGYGDQNPRGYDQGGYDQGGYDQAGYDQAGYGGPGSSGGHGAAGNGYQGNAYDQQGYQGNGYGHEQPPPPRGGHPQAPQSGGGYRGGYTPPEERNVDWLDD